MECGQYGACLAVPRGARPVQCAHCRGVTRFGGMHDAVGFVKGVIANITGGGIRPQPQPPRLSAAGYPRVHGKKRALLVGIKYTTSKTLGELSGPINDVKFMRFLLYEKFGFPSD